VTARPYVLALLAATVLSVVVAWNSSLSLLAVAGSAVLAASLVRKSVNLALLAGCFLYLPLAVALSLALNLVALSYIASGLFIVVMTELATFQYELSAMLESPTGVDSEAASLASEVSRAHAKKLSLYLGLAVLVVAVSAGMAEATIYASELIAAAILLVLLVLVYATR